MKWTSLTNITISLKQNLAYDNNGIYIAICIVCNHKYAGQTKNEFSCIVNACQHTWNHDLIKPTVAESVVLHHCRKPHPGLMHNNLVTYTCFNVMFVQQPSVL